MALTTDDFIATRVHTSDGTSTTTYDFPDVDFINPLTDVEVRIGQTVKTLTTDYTVESGGSTVTGNKIKFTDAGKPASGTSFQIRRKTKRGTREVDFVQGSTLSEADLDKANKQGIYLAEEAIDISLDAEDTAINIVSGSGNLPDPTAGSVDDVMQIKNPSGTQVWTKVAATSLATSAGTAAALDTGTAIGQVPVNSSTGPLKSAAYVATGTGTGDVPLNSQLGSVRTLDAGYAVGEVPTIQTGNKIGPIKELTWDTGYGLHTTTASCEVLHQVTNSSGGDAAKSSYNYGAITKDTWYKYPLQTLNEHNGSYSTGIALYSGGTSSLDDRAVTLPVGVWRVQWNVTFLKPNTVVTRLYNETATSVILQGTTVRTVTTNESAVSQGYGRFSTSGSTDVTIQFAQSETLGATYYDNFGFAYLDEIGGARINNIFGRVVFIKEG